MILAGLLSGCSSVQQKGTVTMQGRGAAALTDTGDPLLGTGVYAKQVPKEFAAGYAKGISDATKREYWALQDSQQKPSNAAGKTMYYNVTIPAHTDQDGVQRAERQVIVPIVE
jgi:hypothetical protein